MYDRAHERFLEASKLQGKAANRFCSVLKLENVPLFLFMLAGRTCLELRKHRGQRLYSFENTTVVNKGLSIKVSLLKK